MTEKEMQVLSGQEKAKLLAIIDDIKFVDIAEADLYRCNNCNSIAIYHYVASCNHVFCGKCHAQNYNKPCPVINCKGTTINEIIQSIDFENDIYNLKVYCGFKGNGCNATVKLSNLLIHHKTCQFSTNNLLPRLWRQDPLKIVEETVTNLKTEITNISKIMTENLKKIEDTNNVLQTEIKNTSKIMTKNVEETMTSLKKENTVISKTMTQNQEKVVETMATLKSKINDVSKIMTENQEKVSRELRELHKQIKEMGQQINFIPNQFEDAKIQIQEMKNINTSYEFYWKISNFSKIKHGFDNKITKEFISNDAKCKIVAELDKSDVYTWVTTACAQCESKGNDLKYFHKTTLYILNQNSGDYLKHITRIGESYFKSGNTNCFIIAINTIKENYFKNGTIVIKLIIEPLLNNYKYIAKNRNGCMIWKIDNYANRKQDEITGITNGIHSDYFLSSEEGYRMQIILYRTNITEKFVNGEFDSILEKEFPHNATFTFMDQSDSQEKKHLIKTIASDKTTFDYVKFSIDQLENEIYLKDDCIIVKVTVERT